MSVPIKKINCDFVKLRISLLHSLVNSPFTFRMGSSVLFFCRNLLQDGGVAPYSSLALLLAAIIQGPADLPTSWPIDTCGGVGTHLLVVFTSATMASCTGTMCCPVRASPKGALYFGTLYVAPTALQKFTARCAVFYPTGSAKLERGRKKCSSVGRSKI
jgi:hypothetical protein